MGLLKKLLGGKARSGGSASVPASSHFHESETTAQKPDSANAPRRELIQVVMRDTMRKHAIPSDWIDCRILSVVTRQHKAGMHVQFIVRQGEERLLEYVHPFQDTFWKELEKFEARPREWLFSLAWQFDGDHGAAGGVMLGADGWSDDTQPPELDDEPGHDEAQATQPPSDEHPDQLQSDLQALYAIRDAALSEPAELAADRPAPPGRPPGRS
jgi:hypothetical protein